MPKVGIRTGPTQAKAVGTSDVSHCTPASGTKAVLRHIKATNCDTSTTHYLCVSVGANTTGNRFIDQIPIAPNAEYDRWLELNVAAAEIVCVGADTADKITVTFDGYLYTIG